MPRRTETTNISDCVAQAQALMAAGDTARAVHLLKAQLRNGRGGILTRLALGRALCAVGDTDEALATLRETVTLAPSVADAALALGEALLAAGHLPTAIAEFQRALALDPRSESARYALGCAWLEVGETVRATEFLSLLAKPESTLAPRAREKLSEADALVKAPRCPPGYVKHLFDQFSSDYDMRMLSGLSYRAHLVLRALANMVVAAAPHSLAILDLGCGTGLAGDAFKDLAHRFDGIDLSPRMIEHARARGIYEALDVTDLEVALAQPGRSYDLLLAADTLVYLGDLAPIFEGASRRLKAQGFFLFTVEKGTGESFELGPKRRYRHGEAYLRAQAARFGFEVMGLLDCVPRTEAGSPLEGLAVALQQRKNSF